MPNGDPICQICGHYNCSHLEAGLGGSPSKFLSFSLKQEVFESPVKKSFGVDVKDTTCPVCDSKNLVKYKEVRDDTQEIEYLCHCNNCGEEGDFMGINDAIYYWSKLPVRRRFDHYSDYRDEGPQGKIVKYRVDFDREVNDPERIKKI